MLDDVLEIINAVLAGKTASLLIPSWTLFSSPSMRLDEIEWRKGNGERDLPKSSISECPSTLKQSKLGRVIRDGHVHSVASVRADQQGRAITLA